VAAEPQKNAASNGPSETELPGEKTAVILSSQGAEKRLIRHIQPAYPVEARKGGVEGTVVLKTVVSETGAVEGVRLVEGNPTLAAAAISSVKQWRYRPYVRDGKAQSFQTIVLVEFQRP
jgi:TonB family protein